MIDALADLESHEGYNFGVEEKLTTWITLKSGTKKAKKADVGVADIY